MSIAPVRKLINHHSPRQQQISLFPARETGCPRPARRYQLSLSTLTTPPLSSIAVRAPFVVVNVKGKWHVRRRITPSVICGRDNAPGEPAAAIFGMKPDRRELKHERRISILRVSPSLSFSHLHFSS
jgi:hypothetical protein